ncbi:MAG: phage holin family protein [Alphaproteobacteria bacterium]|nr:MAG: phage holin family protein [Alphaproteobacteria bacterium]
MAPLLQILQQLLLSNLPSRRTDFFRHSKAAIGLLATAGILAVLMLLYLSFALYTSLLIYWMPAVAALATAGVFFALAGLAVLMASHLFRKAGRSARESEDELRALMESVVANTGDDLMEAAADNPKTAMLVAAMAGLAAGKYFG